MSVKKAEKVAVVRGMAFSLITGIYIVLGSGVSSFLWCVYVGFLLTVAFGCGKDLLWRGPSSLAIGYGWAFLYMMLPVAVSQYINIPSIAVAMICEAMLTGGLLFLHLTLFKKTIFNRIPYIFLAVATVFAQGDMKHLPITFVSVCVGILMALGTGVIIDVWSKNDERNAA